MEVKWPAGKTEGKLSIFGFLSYDVFFWIKKKQTNQYVLNISIPLSQSCSFGRCGTVQVNQSRALPLWHVAEREEGREVRTEINYCLLHACGSCSRYLLVVVLPVPLGWVCASRVTNSWCLVALLPHTSSLCIYRTLQWLLWNSVSCHIH